MQRLERVESFTQWKLGQPSESDFPQKTWAGSNSKTGSLPACIFYIHHAQCACLMPYLILRRVFRFLRLIFFAFLLIPAWLGGRWWRISLIARRCTGVLLHLVPRSRSDAPMPIQQHANEKRTFRLTFGCVAPAPHENSDTKRYRYDVKLSARPLSLSGSSLLSAPYTLVRYR